VVVSFGLPVSCNSKDAMYDKQKASPTALHQKGCSSPARPVSAAAAAQTHIAAVGLLRLVVAMMRHVQHLTGMTTKHSSLKVAAPVEPYL
jgi:hypothetical protein